MITEIDVNVPLRTAYNQWTQFRDFPLFMDHVKQVDQLDDTHVRFTASIAGVKREWEAEITEQTPDQRIAWTTLDGTETSGVVTFHALSDATTRVVLQLEMDPQGLLEHIADKGGFVSDRAKKDLAAFKEFVETRGRETGAYRGKVTRDAHRDQQQSRERYLDLSKDELYELAQEQNIEGRGQMTKSELVDALSQDERRRAS
jgi:uncharacterized membrane protein